MDPEDLLEAEVEPLEDLPEHIDENRKAIATLQQKGLNFRYVDKRLSDTAVFYSIIQSDPHGLH
jgi:hypothetical protein